MCVCGGGKEVKCVWRASVSVVGGAEGRKISVCWCMCVGEGRGMCVCLFVCVRACMCVVWVCVGVCRLASNHSWAWHLVWWPSPRHPRYPTKLVTQSEQRGLPITAPKINSCRVDQVCAGVSRSVCVSCYVWFGGV